MEYIKCHDCKTEIDIHFERVYELDLGFLGTIDLCLECLNNRGFDSCPYCMEIHDLDDMIDTGNDYYCNLCKDDLIKKTVNI